ncbi:hypothetical protein PSPTOT1_3423 [Pseudomonas syringae pv. tomato T1]|nr:hypothetical protein PSPTOT1_3423 [Pseudomonas syringae pv. tomato T1]
MYDFTTSVEPIFSIQFFRLLAASSEPPAVFICTCSIAPSWLTESMPVTPSLPMPASSCGNHFAMSLASKLPAWPCMATASRAFSMILGSVILAFCCSA